jgi:DTW domain-containing protein
MLTKGKRKTQAPCQICFLHVDRCICEFIPKLDLKTKICLVVHARELKRTTNTGRLAVEALINSEMRVRGEGREALDLTDWVQDSKYRTLLFFPAEGAQELTPGFLARDPRPIQLIVPDGNWRQASKVHTRYPELSEIPRVMIKTPNKSEYHLRAETTPEGMATLQAIAEAVKVIEGESAYQPLIGLYQAKLNATLLGRGILKTRSSP